MKLGIVVVYFQEDSDFSLLQVHLSKIKEYTSSDYNIFAGNNGLPPSVLEFLKQDPCVNIFSPPVKSGEDSGLNVSQQISAFTDYLVHKAFSAGSTHVAIMHNDSFPVQSRWDLTLANKLDQGHAFSAILRRENFDTVLSFPACIFFSESFHRQYKPTMYPEDTPGYREFLDENEQIPDCGIGYSYAAYHAGLSWHPLLRSNQADKHPIISGIYGDLIFHLGGGTRASLGRLYFKSDVLRTGETSIFRDRLSENSNQSKKTGAFNLIGRLGNIFKKIMKFWRHRRIQNIRSTSLAANQAAMKEATLCLIADPDSYINSLRFGG